MPEPVYCTKIASRLTRTYTDKHGLKDLVREVLGHDLSKQQQSSDWGAAELSDAQISYAASDVLYLHALKERLTRCWRVKAGKNWRRLASVSCRTGRASTWRVLLPRIFSPIHRANGPLPCGICCTLLPGRAPCERAQFTNIPGRMSRQTGAQPALHRPVGATFVGDNSQAEPLKRAAVPNRAPVLRGIPLSSTYPIGSGRRTNISTASRGDADQRYRRAMRHSRLVQWLRLGVPAVLAAALIVVVGANYMPTVGGLRLPGELGKMVIKGTKVTMQQPRLTGYTVDSRPYEFTAHSAEQDILKPDLMELHQIQAKMEMEDKSTVNVTSASGSYDMKTEILNLSESIHLLSSTGYEARLSDAAIDVHKGVLVSDKPVWVKLTGTVINAKRLEVRDSGAVIRFDGGVTMVVQPDQVTAQANER